MADRRWQKELLLLSVGDWSKKLRNPYAYLILR